MLAKVAVTSVSFWVDKPYDYKIPAELLGTVAPGIRVIVPFGPGNRRAEAVVLALTEDGGPRPMELKTVESLLDEEPVLTQGQLKLALWMRERFFCTVGDAVRAMLPAGLWFGGDHKRKVRDKTVKLAALAVSGEDASAAAASKRRSAPQQAAILELLAAAGSAAVSDIKRFTGAGASSMKSLQSAGLITVWDCEAFRRPAPSTTEIRPLPVLNADQEEVFCGLSGLLSERGETALLWGVTGSGKTAVYMHLISKVLSDGKTAILMVPEIALTPQMLSAFSEVFGDEVAVLHSSLSIAERYDEWKRVKTGRARLVIGTRSAVFAPTENLGIIIIDEEQEQTYKSEGKPRYHTRDVARYRAYKSGALLLLGSATPSVETRYHSLGGGGGGKYHYFALPRRFNRHALPGVHIVDMKRELRAGNGGSISSTLRGEISKNLSSGEQSILFLNRRGYGKLLTCSECGYAFSCPKCSVYLTYHSFSRRLMCHYCGFSRAPGEVCPDCGGRLLLIGTGTQKVETELSELFPGTEILRMDADTVSASGSHASLLGRFQRERIPIMIGTQMITKGLDFENVTLVGVLSADQSLYVGDYRAGERTFSLITQVVGRSGRGGKPGRAVIQTFTPANQVITLASSQDYESFFRGEIELRRLQGAPPFADIISLTASGGDEPQVLRCLNAIKGELLSRLTGHGGVRLLGPAPYGVVRVNNRYRYKLTLTCRADRKIRELIAYLVCAFSTNKEFKGVSVYADADPAE